MEPEEVELIAESTWIEIIPSFSDGPLHLIQGEVGPFEAGIPLNVPIWVALYLKQRHQCRIPAPEWLEVTKLEEILSLEQESPRFAAVPPHFFHVARQLIQICAHDLVDTDRIKSLLQDIRDLRAAKLEKSVSELTEAVESGSLVAKLNHLTRMEISENRLPLMDVLNLLAKLRRAALSHEGTVS